MAPEERNRLRAFCAGALPVMAFCVETAWANGLTDGIVEAARTLYSILRTVAIPAAAIALAFAGYMIFTQGEDGMEHAKKVILWILIGVMVIFLGPVAIDAAKQAFDPSGGSSLPSGFNPY